MENELFGDEVKTLPPVEFHTAAELQEWCAVQPDIHPWCTVQWGKQLDSLDPVMMFDADYTKYEYAGYDERGTVRLRTRVHSIKDNYIYRIIKRYLDQGYKLHVAVSSSGNRHPDTCAILAYKERNLGLEEQG